MHTVLLIFKEESLGSLYREDLSDLGLLATSVDTPQKAISILNEQKFDLIILGYDLWNEQELKDILNRIDLLKRSDKNIKLLAMSVFSEYGEKNAYGFADAVAVLSTGPEWKLVVYDLLGIDRKVVWDYYERNLKPMEGRADRMSVQLFICYGREDFEQAHGIYEKLRDEGYTPWMDKENIVGGQDWELEITRAIEGSKFFLACLSRNSVNKEGYVQKELKKGLEILDRQPEGNIYLIPVRLDDCGVAQRFKRISWINLFEPNGTEELLKAIETGCTQRGF